MIKWIKDRIGHKLEHISLSAIKKTFKQHGLALAVIVVLWEIIEDILFPVMFLWLGENIHPAFYAGAPVSWLICLHWLAVPLMWAAWIKLSRQQDSKKEEQ